MKFALVALSAAALLSAGAAAAQDQVSEQAFLQANRCEGIAAGLGLDVKAVRHFISRQSTSRADMIIYRGHAEAGQAEREAADPARRAALTAELAGPCAPYLGPQVQAALAAPGGLSRAR